MVDLDLPDQRPHSLPVLAAVVAAFREGELKMQEGRQEDREAESLLLLADNDDNDNDNDNDNNNNHNNNNSNITSWLTQ